MLSILLINDNKIVSRLLQLSSKKSGFDIEESGVFAPQKEAYNLIFVDSDKYSDELLEKIKENLTYDKLVFIGTAQVKKPDGFELVLEKPFLPTDFTSLVEKNFIVKKEEDEEKKSIDFDDMDDEVDELLKDDDLEDNLELDIDDSAMLDNSVENLAQMVDEIDEIDSNNNQEEVEKEKEEDNQKEKEESLDLDTNSDISMDDELNIDEELFDEESNNESEEEVEEESLPDIDEEIEEKNIQEEKEKYEDFKSLDKDEVKSVVEGDDIKKDNTQEIDDKTEQTLSQDDTISKIIEDDIKEQTSNIPNNLEEIVEKKLKEIITPELIRDAFKNIRINITFEDK